MQGHQFNRQLLNLYCHVASSLQYITPSQQDVLQQHAAVATSSHEVLLPFLQTSTRPALQAASRWHFNTFPHLTHCCQSTEGCGCCITWSFSSLRRFKVATIIRTSLGDANTRGPRFRLTRWWLRHQLATLNMSTAADVWPARLKAAAEAAAGAWGLADPAMLSLPLAMPLETRSCSYW